MDPLPLNTVVAVPPTPFLEDGALDEAAFESVLKRAIDGGLRAVTIAGNTGEFGALSAPEIERLVEIATGVLGQHAVLLVGTGGDLSTARRVASKAAAAGAFGVMVHEPAGPFRSPEGWIRYHAELASAVPDLAIVPYIRDAAVRPEDLHALVATAANVVAVKYAVPDPVRFAEIVDSRPAAALDLRSCGTLGAVLLARRGNGIHVGSGARRATPVSRASGASSRPAAV